MPLLHLARLNHDLLDIQILGAGNDPAEIAHGQREGEIHRLQQPAEHGIPAAHADHEAGGTTADGQPVRELHLALGVGPLGSCKQGKGDGICEEQDEETDVGPDRADQEDEGEQADEEVEEPEAVVEARSEDA